MMVEEVDEEEEEREEERFPWSIGLDTLVRYLDEVSREEGRGEQLDQSGGWSL